MNNSTRTGNHEINALETSIESNSDSINSQDKISIKEMIDNLSPK